MDLPHTLYNFKGRDKDGKRTIQVRVNPQDPAFEKQREAYEKALALRKAKMEGKVPYTMREVFG